MITFTVVCRAAGHDTEYTENIQDFSTAQDIQYVKMCEPYWDYVSIEYHDDSIH